MLSNIDKIADKISYFDGGFRRRMTAGTLLTIFVVLGLFSESKPEIVELVEYTSPGLLALLFLLVHAVGGLVDVFASLFMSRLAGNIAWTFERPRLLNKTSKHTLGKLKPLKSGRYLIILIRYLLRPIVSFLFHAIVLLIKFPIGFVSAFIGVSFYHWASLKDQLTDTSSRLVDDYPENVQLSLDDPFGKKRRFLWVYFGIIGASDEVKSLARQLEARNHEVLSIITASMLGLGALSVDYLPALSDPIGLEAVLFDRILQYSLISYFILFIFYAYIMLLRQSILTIIELNSTQLQISTLTRHDSTPMDSDIPPSSLID